MPRGVRVQAEQAILGQIEHDLNGGCWLWTGYLTKKGYGELTFEGKSWRAHRLSYKAFKGPIPDGFLVMHGCDVRCCVNPDHLGLGTAADNSEDMKRKGRTKRIVGEQNVHSKLTNVAVAIIRSTYARKEANMRELASAFRVSQSLVWRVISGGHRP